MLKSEAINNGIVSVVIQNVKIFTDICGIFPLIAMPGKLEISFNSLNIQTFSTNVSLFIVIRANCFSYYQLK